MIKLREHLRISLDIDGVLADFETAYLRRFKKWPNHDWAITRNVANILIHERDFWLNLPVLNKIEFTPKMYCSARVNPKRWTKQYLRNNDFPEAFLFQVPGYKLSKANTLKGRCDVHIEDSVKNFLDLNRKGIPCLLYSNAINEYLGPILRIESLNEDEITDVYWLAKEMNIFEDFNKYFSI
jgi:uncharacterized HAD superfamily protein